ncbi:hypothetical protein [Streptomyces sp. NPDC059452]|uniref:hypothetical protein n=1 Tax=Streptomyces sp. NPDC059452 TaxID=3346835 RepID=UPI003690E971
MTSDVAGLIEETTTAAHTLGGSDGWLVLAFDEAELAGVAGGRFLDLARTGPPRYAVQAADHIRTALASRGAEAGRSHALDRIGLAECQFLAGDIHAAAAETALAVQAARE